MRRVTYVPQYDSVSVKIHFLKNNRIKHNFKSANEYFTLIQVKQYFQINLIYFTGSFLFDC